MLEHSGKLLKERKSKGNLLEKIKANNKIKKDDSCIIEKDVNNSHIKLQKDLNSQANESFVNKKAPGKKMSSFVPPKLEEEKPEDNITMETKNEEKKNKMNSEQAIDAISRIPSKIMETPMNQVKDNNVNKSIDWMDVNKNASRGATPVKNSVNNSLVIFLFLIFFIFTL